VDKLTTGYSNAFRFPQLQRKLAAGKRSKDGEAAIEAA
jgi:hypothetical protein